MSKYIDAEKLIAEIKRQIRLEKLNFAALGGGGQLFCINTLEWVLKRIDSLQQEQPKLPGIEDPGIPGKDFIPVEWVDACEMYGKWKIVKQEQPEVDLEKELRNYKVPFNDCGWERLCYNTLKDIARHFAEWGAIHLNARK